MIIQKKQTYSLQQDLYRVTRDRDALEEQNKKLLDLSEWNDFSTRHGSSEFLPLPVPLPSSSSSLSLSLRREEGKQWKERERERRGMNEDVQRFKEEDLHEVKTMSERKKSPSLWKRLGNLFHRTHSRQEEQSSPSSPSRHRRASSPIPGMSEGVELHLRVPTTLLPVISTPTSITPRSKSEDYPSSKEDLRVFQRKPSRKGSKTFGKTSSGDSILESASLSKSSLNNSLSALQSPRRNSLLSRVSRSPSEPRSISSESDYESEPVYGLQL